MGHHDLAFLTGNEYPEWAIQQPLSLSELLDNLDKELKAWKGNIIFSSENFYLLSNPVDVREALSKVGVSEIYTIKVLVYIRRQDEAHLSWYNQIVKAQGYTGTINDSLKQYHDLWDYNIQLSRWADVFGKNNIIVRPYQLNDLLNGDICSDFICLVSLPQKDFNSLSEENKNTRINRDVLEFQRMVNRLPLSPREKRRFHKELIELTSATSTMDLFNDLPLLNNTQRQEILSSYAESNARISCNYFNSGQLFDHELPADNLAAGVDNELTLEKLSYILGWLLARSNK